MWWCFIILALFIFCRFICFNFLLVFDFAAVVYAVILFITFNLTIEKWHEYVTYKSTNPNITVIYDLSLENWLLRHVIFINKFPINFKICNTIKHLQIIILQLLFSGDLVSHTWWIWMRHLGVIWDGCLIQQWYFFVRLLHFI